MVVTIVNFYVKMNVVSVNLENVMIVYLDGRLIYKHIYVK